MEKTLGDIAVGQDFKVNNQEFTKINDIRVNCCKVLNCHVKDDVNNKTFFPNNTVVTINE